MIEVRIFSTKSKYVTLNSPLGLEIVLDPPRLTLTPNWLLDLHHGSLPVIQDHKIH
jgi:hypothetical protein